ncbi:MAG: hypothetical protein ACYDC2_01790 [Solirubrobacteraceae bacterium]
MSMYHIELRQFPRNLNRFNLSGQQIGAILLPWAQKEPVEVNGQHWDPREATIRVIEGPEIPVHRLSLGRGWPLAERQGQDVTGRVLEEARRAVAGGSAHRPAPPALPEAEDPAEDYPSAGSAAGSLAVGVELAGLLGPEAAPLLAAWRELSARTSGLSPSETLALAERELGGGAGR